jgi:hypothetical protein
MRVLPSLYTIDRTPVQRLPFGAGPSLNSGSGGILKYTGYTLCFVLLLFKLLLLLLPFIFVFDLHRTNTPRFS